MELWQVAGLYLVFISFFALGAVLAHLVATAIRKLSSCILIIWNMPSTTHSYMPIA